MLIIGIIMMLNLPEEIVQTVPYIQVVTVWHYLLIGIALTLAGFVNTHPLFGTIPSFIRGFTVGALVNLDYMLYSWADQTTFWSILVATGVLAGIVDYLATKFAGEGVLLTKGISK